MGILTVLIPVMQSRMWGRLMGILGQTCCFFQWIQCSLHLVVKSNVVCREFGLGLPGLSTDRAGPGAGSVLARTKERFHQR